MNIWRFYQGLRTEWRWYCLDSDGRVLRESDRGFEELRACMSNAEIAGFTGQAYQVHARQAGTFAGQAEEHERAESEELNAKKAPDTADEQATS